ncbi:indolethylamine N-methyltransferase-like isoform 2-T2 [Mantella aurantiaca]
MEKIFKAISSAGIKDGSLTDISLGPLLHHIFLVRNFFKDISLLRFSGRCIMELRKWQDGNTGTYDWSFVSSVESGLMESSDAWDVKEKQLKKAIKQVMISDIANKNLTDPVVMPQTDVVISTWILEVTSTNDDEFMATLRKVMKFVKPGGLLLLTGTVNGTSFKVGQDNIHLFKHDEIYVKNALTKEGFTVTDCDVLKRSTVSDLTDYQGMYFIAARNNK